MSYRDDFPDEVPGLTLDHDTADRLLAGLVAPPDAPPGFGDLAALLQAAGQPTSDELVREDETVAAIVAIVRSQQAAAAPVRRRRAGRGWVRARLAVVVAVALAGTTSALAATGELPRPIQNVASDVLGGLGIDVPSSEERDADERAGLPTPAVESARGASLGSDGLFAVPQLDLPGEHLGLARARATAPLGGTRGAPVQGPAAGMATPPGSVPALGPGTGGPETGGPATDGGVTPATAPVDGEVGDDAPVKGETGGGGENGAPDPKGAGHGVGTGEGLGHVKEPKPKEAKPKDAQPSESKPKPKSDPKPEPKPEGSNAARTEKPATPPAAEGQRRAEANVTAARTPRERQARTPPTLPGQTP